MLIRDWLSHAEVRRIGAIVAVYLVAIAGVVTVAAALGRPSGEYKYQYSSSADGPGSFWAPRTDGPVAQPQAGKYEASCAAPKDRDEADLCQQWRAAKAAEDSVTLAKGQGAWNVAQVVATIIAAAATGYAAWAAARAARSAEDALKHAQKSAAIEQRAYINIKSVHLVFGIADASFGREIFIDLVLENFGETPAHDTVLNGFVLVSGKKDDFIAQNYGSVGPSGQVKFRTKFEASLDDVMALSAHDRKERENPPISIKGIVTYSTVFDRNQSGWP